MCASRCRRESSSYRAGLGVPAVTITPAYSRRLRSARASESASLMIQSYHITGWLARPAPGLPLPPIATIRTHTGTDASRPPRAVVLAWSRARARGRRRRCWTLVGRSASIAGQRNSGSSSRNNTPSRASVIPGRTGVPPPIASQFASTLERTTRTSSTSAIHRHRPPPHPGSWAHLSP
jgi:hypothetical protein